MEQDRGGGGGGGRGRGVEIKGSGLQPHHPPPTQPQKCPRCDSSNTKFCYYNNYSLSQPRYFCKTCRRYWTQGGTLRNVPVGGGCRKGKRLKRSSSPSPSTDNLLGSNSSAPTASIGHLRSKGADIGIATSPLVPILQPSMYYPGSGVGGGGGFFSSLAAFQSLDQTLNIGGGGGGEFGGSSLALLQGFGLPFHTQQMHHQQQMQHQHQHQHQQQEQFYLEQSHNLNMGSASDEEKVRHSSSHQEWSNPISSETADYWNNSNTNNNNHNNDIGVNTTSTSLGVSLNPPPHWMDNLPDFASPPALPASPPPPSPLAATPNTSSPPSFL